MTHDRPDLAFCQRLPKVELHAHLSGSISRDILQSIYDASPKELQERLQPPEEALADPSQAQDINTYVRLPNSH